MGLTNTLSTHPSPPASQQCADHKVEALCEALQAIVQQWRGRFPSPLPLELYTSSNFIGLFVEEQVADILKQFAADFATEAARKAGREERVSISSPSQCNACWPVFPSLQNDLPGRRSRWVIKALAQAVAVTHFKHRRKWDGLPNSIPGS